jgi:hypothetical protein
MRDRIIDISEGEELKKAGFSQVANMYYIPLHPEEPVSACKLVEAHELYGKDKKDVIAAHNFWELLSFFPPTITINGHDGGRFTIEKENDGRFSVGYFSDSGRNVTTHENILSAAVKLLLYLRSYKNL